MARFNYIAVMIATSLALSGCMAPRRSQNTEASPVAQAPAAPVVHEQPAAPAAAAPTPPPPSSPPPTPPAPAPAAPLPAQPKPASPTATAPNSASPGAPAHRPVAKTTTAGAAPGKGATPATPAAPTAPTLDLGSLEQRLKDTRAIGVFTKLSLKNQVDDLLSELRAFHSGSSKTPQAELRQKYDTLIIKVLTLLQNGDPQLATAVASSREALWGILMDPKKFSHI
jgi:outer membrane biosynthesis protein TonB